jgi:hypothetical protein
MSHSNLTAVVACESFTAQAAALLACHKVPPALLHPAHPACLSTTVRQHFVAGLYVAITRHVSYCDMAGAALANTPACRPPAPPLLLVLR